VYDPYQKFHVTSKHLKAFQSKTPPEAVPDSLRELLGGLSHKTFGTGHQVLEVCAAFLARFPDFHNLILACIDKDLKIRMGVKMVNKAFPMLVPDFSCALGYKLEDQQKFFDSNKQHFMASRKLDGVRCIFVCRNGTCTTMSRSGHEYPGVIPGLQVFLDELPNLLSDQVLDGEMTVMDEEEMEHFDVANSIMNVNARADGKRGKHTKQLAENQTLVFQAFDLLDLAVFQGRERGRPLQDRQDQLREFYEQLYETDSPLVGKLHRLAQHRPADFDQLWEESKSKGWEGLIYRFNGPYAGKKSRDILKRKMVSDQEFEVLDVVNREILPPGGTEPESVCGRFRIQFKGCDVWVGSGLSWDQRVQFKNTQKGKQGDSPLAGQQRDSPLIGQQVTVAYTEELATNDGFSLRFPRLKAVHGRKRKS
jgi:hypothetical protein